MLTADRHIADDFKDNLQRLTTGPPTGHVLTATVSVPNAGWPNHRWTSFEDQFCDVSAGVGARGGPEKLIKTATNRLDPRLETAGRGPQRSEPRARLPALAPALDQ